MAEVAYSTTAKLPIDTIWDFVKEMDNWAVFVAGYQEHQKQNETDSVWVLKGDVGSLTRTLKFDVHITEWAGPERVSFELKGINEQLEGSGEFLMQSYGENSAAEAPSPPKKNPFMRLIEAILRFFFRLVYGEAERGAHADAGPGEGMARLSFKLEIRPGGPMAPMINAMVKPAMAVAAEDLAQKIIGHLELQRGRNE